MTSSEPVTNLGIRGEIDNAVGDIVRLADMADRVHGIGGFAAFSDIAGILEIILDHRSPDVAGMNGVHADVQP